MHARETATMDARAGELNPMYNYVCALSRGGRVKRHWDRCRGRDNNVTVQDAVFGARISSPRAFFSSG